MLIEPKGSPLLHFSALCDIFCKKKIKNFKFLLKKSLLRILSLRYSADFRRSRLVFFFSWQSHCEWSTFYNFHDPLTATLDILLSLGIEVTAFLRSAEQNDVGSSPTLTENFFVHVFRLCDAFFRKIFHCLQRVPLLQKNGCSKNPKGPPFTFFGTIRLTGHQKNSKKNFKKKLWKKFKKTHFFHYFLHAGTVEKNTWHSEVFLLVLSLRYGADLGRSRLVSFSADSVTLNGPLFYNLLFICSTNFLRSSRTWVQFSH